MAPIVIDPPGAPPLTPPADDGSNVWELLYEALGFHRDDDALDPSAPLRKLCESLTLPVQFVYDLVRERDDARAWTILFDPDRCPAECLPYLAQYVGVVITAEMSEAQIRNEIREPTGWARGRPPAIRIATARTLKPVDDEELMVIIRARTPGPGQHYIRTLLSQTPEPDRSEYVIRKAVPAWEVLDYAAIDGVVFTDTAASWADFGSLAADKASFRDLAETLPTELP
jgi:hypothetical protein